jgi:arylsulfatase A-like enzyme
MSTTPTTPTPAPLPFAEGAKPTATVQQAEGATVAAAKPLGVGATVATYPDANRERPNVVLIVLDDIGIDLLYTYGNGYGANSVDENAWTSGDYLKDGGADAVYPYTPTIHSLASSGVVFSQARAMPVCTPWRASFISGRYPSRTGMTWVIGGQVEYTVADGKIVPGQSLVVGAGGQFLGDPDHKYEYSIARHMKAKGYETSIFGKWHLGVGDDTMTTNDSPDTVMRKLDGSEGPGWEHIFTGVTTDGSTAVGQFEKGFVLWQNPKGSPSPGIQPGQPVFEGRSTGYDNYTSCTKETTTSTKVIEENVGEAQWLIKRTFDEMIDYVNGDNGEGTGNWTGANKRDMTKPFFMYCPANAVHSPWYDGAPRADVTTPEFLNSDESWLAGISGGMLESFDTHLGRFLTGMSSGVRDNTIFIITSDNGTSQEIIDSMRDGAEVDDADHPDGAVTAGDFARTFGATMEAVHDHARADGEAGRPRRYKRSCYEMGIRVPLIVNGPVRFVRGNNRKCDALVDLGPDLHQTLIEIAGSKVTDIVTDGRPVDGTSLLPAMRTLNWNYEHGMGNAIAWASGVAFAINAHTKGADGEIYVARTTHTSGASSEPGVGASWRTDWKHAPSYSITERRKQSFSELVIPTGDPTLNTTTNLKDEGSDTKVRSLTMWVTDDLYTPPGSGDIIGLFKLIERNGLPSSGATGNAASHTDQNGRAFYKLRNADGSTTGDADPWELATDTTPGGQSIQGVRTDGAATYRQAFGVVFTALGNLKGDMSANDW